MQKYPILAVVGASGSGKSTIIVELLKRAPERFFVVKSLASRAKREAQDDIFYRFLPKEEIIRMHENGELVQYLEYAGNYYGCAKTDVDWAVSKGIGIQAYVQSAIANLRDGVYEVIPIKIVPDKEFFRNESRVEVDRERDKIELDYKLIVENSFQPGGLQSAVQKVLDFVKTLPA